ncbi:MAG: hypothetical protein WC455_11875 [Dehalococcoidia bacterium]
MSTESREEELEFWEGIARAWPYIGRIISDKIAGITDKMIQHGTIKTLEDLSYEQGRIDAYKTILRLPEEQSRILRKKGK